MLDALVIYRFLESQPLRCNQCHQQGFSGGDAVDRQALALTAAIASLALAHGALEIASTQNCADAAKLTE